MPPIRNARTTLARTSPTEVRLSSHLQDEAINPYESKIQHLENYISELHTFIDNSGQRPGNSLYPVQSVISFLNAILDVPQTIAAVLDSQPGSALILSFQLHAKVRKAYEKLDEQIVDQWCGITSDDFIEAMAKFIPSAKRLSRLPEGPELAFDLLVELGENSYGHLEEPHGCGEGRPHLYHELDEAMLQVAKCMDWKTDLASENIARLEKTADFLMGFGIDGYAVMCLRYLTQLQYQA
ncbi:MAG: hypothetical protein M1812_003061 [Candelaria pacifica]|nr:MAG: hypothetical protein M1812_003061 [Candelaria pacifica]